MLKPYGRNKLHFIVVGTGRCGTVYFAQLLSLINIPCSHERLFGPNGLEHTAKVLEKGGKNSEISKNSGLKNREFVMAEASYMAVPYLSYSILRDATIIHVVRNPIDVILSFHNKLQYWHKSPSKWEDFILSHMPEIKQYHTPLMKNCCYVVRWNQWIETQSKDRKYIRIRLEYDQDKLLNYLKVPRGLWPDLKTMNTFEQWKQKRKPLDKPATAEDILKSGFANQVKLMMEKYGYIVNGTKHIHTQDAKD